MLTEESLLMMSNDGQGQFQQVFPFSSQEYSYRSASAADFDLDGDLDLYLCSYNGAEVDRNGFPNAMPLHDANNGGRNVLLRNDGNWHFSDVTEQVGLDVNNRRFSFAASWEDYDNDGDPDLYVANDFGRNNLYQNNQGKFTDVTERSNAEDGNFGMSVCWGDVNRDGWQDVYIGNMFSSAGNRVMTQTKFKPQLDAESRQRFMQLARGNTLLQNQGNGSFADVSVAAGVTQGRWSWGSIFVDINQDGWEDLVVTNGYITSKSDPGDL